MRKISVFTMLCMLTLSVHAQLVTPIDFLETDPFNNLEISADGATIFALNEDSITSFDRNAQTGLLNLAGTVGFDVNGRSAMMQLSANDRFLYAGREAATDLALYTRNPVTGELELTDESVLDLNPDPMNPEFTTQYFALSPTGDNIYVIVYPVDLNLQDNPGRLHVYSVESSDGSASLMQTMVFNDVPLRQRIPSNLFITPDNRHLYLDHRPGHFVYEIAADGRLILVGAGDLLFQNTPLLPVAISADSERVIVIDNGPPTSPPLPKNLGVLNRDSVSGNLTFSSGFTLPASFFGPNLSDQSADALLAGERLLVLTNGDAHMSGSIFRLDNNGQSPLLLPESQFSTNPMASGNAGTMIASPDEQHLYYTHGNGIAIYAFNGSLPPQAMPVPALQMYGLVLLAVVLLVIGMMIRSGNFKTRA